MGWSGTYINYWDKQMSKKDLVLKYYLNNVTNKIKHIENKGNEVWIIMEDENKEQFAGVVLTKIQDGMFWTKEIGISSCPFYYNCSKKFVSMVKDIYENKENKLHFNLWLSNYENFQNAKTKRKNAIKNLKIGDKIHFTEVSYNSMSDFTVTSIVPEITFNWYKLKGWKQQEFEIIKNI